MVLLKCQYGQLGAVNITFMVNLIISIPRLGLLQKLTIMYMSFQGVFSIWSLNLKGFCPEIFFVDYYKAQSDLDVSRSVLHSFYQFISKPILWGNLSTACSGFKLYNTCCYIKISKTKIFNKIGNYGKTSLCSFITIYNNIITSNLSLGNWCIWYKCLP